MAETSRRTGPRAVHFMLLRNKRVFLQRSPVFKLSQKSVSSKIELIFKLSSEFYRDLRNQPSKILPVIERQTMERSLLDHNSQLKESLRFYFFTFFCSYFILFENRNLRSLKGLRSYCIGKKKARWRGLFSKVRIFGGYLR